VQEVWAERLKISPRDFDLWFTIIANRLSVTNVHEDSLVKLFELKSITLSTGLHSNACSVLFPNFDGRRRQS
jgi:hypothetical protein